MPPAPGVDGHQWTAARDLLDELRARGPDRPWVERVHVTLREPRTGTVYEGRGAIAVQPGRCARMILVGPGGATALDLWLTMDRWRMHAPALGPPRRGADAPPELPVGFFRWWLLRPWEGRLLTLDGGSLVLRSDGATVRASIATEAAPGGGWALAHVRAERRVAGHTETLEWRGILARPAPGERARYTGESGLSAEVLVESVSFDLDVEGAFLDPDGSPARPEGARGAVRGPT